MMFSCLALWAAATVSALASTLAGNTFCGPGVDFTRPLPVGVRDPLDDHYTQEGVDACLYHGGESVEDSSHATTSTSTAAESRRGASSSTSGGASYGVTSSVVSLWYGTSRPGASSGSYASKKNAKKLPPEQRTTGQNKSSTYCSLFLDAVGYSRPYSRVNPDGTVDEALCRDIWERVWKKESIETDRVERDVPQISALPQHLNFFEQFFTEENHVHLAVVRERIESVSALQHFLEQVRALKRNVEKELYLYQQQTLNYNSDPTATTAAAQHRTKRVFIFLVVQKWFSDYTGLETEFCSFLLQQLDLETFGVPGGDANGDFFFSSTSTSSSSPSYRFRLRVIFRDQESFSHNQYDSMLADARSGENEALLGHPEKYRMYAITEAPECEDWCFFQDDGVRPRKETFGIFDLAAPGPPPGDSVNVRQSQAAASSVQRGSAHQHSTLPLPHPGPSYFVSFLGMCRLGWGFPQSSQVRLNLLPLALYSFFRKDWLVAFSSHVTIAHPGKMGARPHWTKAFREQYMVASESLLSCPTDYVKPVANTLEAWREHYGEAGPLAGPLEEEAIDDEAESSGAGAAEVDVHVVPTEEAARSVPSGSAQVGRDEDEEEQSSPPRSPSAITSSRPRTSKMQLLKKMIKSRQRFYLQQMRNSTFMLLPRGDTRWTHRFYLAMASGSVPVLIADGFGAYPYEPFLGRRLWESTAVKLPERLFVNPYSDLALNKELRRKMFKIQKHVENLKTYYGVGDDHGTREAQEVEEVVPTSSSPTLSAAAATSPPPSRVKKPQLLNSNNYYAGAAEHRQTADDNGNAKSKSFLSEYLANSGRGHLDPNGSKEIRLWKNVEAELSRYFANSPLAGGDKWFPEQNTERDQQLNYRDGTVVAAASSRGPDAWAVAAQWFAGNFSVAGASAITVAGAGASGGGATPAEPRAVVENVLRAFAEKSLARLYQMSGTEVLRRRKNAAYLYDNFLRDPEQRLLALMASVKQIVDADLETDWRRGGGRRRLSSEVDV